MNILVSNDDGIRARGIFELVSSLSGEADIYVCAPNQQRSASGHSISVGIPLEAKEVDFENAKIAYELTGTPADCVKLGLRLLKNRGVDIDMVFTGINHGGNLGTDTLYSGTVSAAVEGAFCGKPSVAVSVNSHHAEHFTLAGKLAVGALRKSFGKLDDKTILNINTPNLPEEEIKGIKYTRLGRREYEEWFHPKTDENGNVQYWYEGKAVVYEDLPDDIDVIAMQQGYATITPLQYDLTNHDLIEEVKKWRIEE